MPDPLTIHQIYGWWDLPGANRRDEVLMEKINHRCEHEGISYQLHLGRSAAEEILDAFVAMASSDESIDAQSIANIACDFSVMTHDLFRWIAVYTRGGVYLDSDVIWHDGQAICAEMKAHDVFLTYEPMHAIANWLIYARRGSPTALRIIEAIAQRVLLFMREKDQPESRFYDEHFTTTTLAVTGPWFLTRLLADYTERNPFHENGIPRIVNDVVSLKDLDLIVLPQSTFEHQFHGSWYVQGNLTHVAETQKDTAKSAE